MSIIHRHSRSRWERERERVNIGKKDGMGSWLVGSREGGIFQNTENRTSSFGSFLQICMHFIGKLAAMKLHVNHTPLTRPTDRPLSHIVLPSLIPFPPALSELHRNWKQLDLRTSARNPAWDEEEFPKELRDAVPPVASCQV